MTGITLSTVPEPARVTRIGEPLTDLGSCPHCGVNPPNITMVAKPQNALIGRATGERRVWGLYACASCAGGLLAEAPDTGVQNPIITNIIPQARTAHEDLPPMAQTYLNQAFATLAAPDAAAVMAGSAVDAMLKALGYEQGSVYSRIDQAVGDNKLTAGMAQWAHAVRLGANRPRHADLEAPHVTIEEAKQSVAFAEALGNFLFVLTARIERGITAA